MAVVAHPDDESFGLGGLLHAFTGSGSRVSVLCLTRGEASTIHDADGDLATVRGAELRSAAGILGVESVRLRDYPDGALSAADPDALARDVRAAIGAADADGLLVFDPEGITGHPDHMAATQVALRVADETGLPVLAWILPGSVTDTLNDEFDAGFVGHTIRPDDIAVTVDRDRQRKACAAHASQAPPTSVLWRRLDLLGNVDHVRWLRPPPDDRL